MDYRIDVEGHGLLYFTITRESKRNAVNFQVMEGLKKAIERAKEDDIKALVVTGEGERAFCSGGDLSEFHALKTESEAYEMLSKMGKILYELATLPKPTIALINGTAVGGGCEIATACDFRIARRNTKLGFIQGSLAITTGWGGGTLLLERVQPSIGLKILSEAAVYKSDSLHSVGFIDQLVDHVNKEAVEVFLEKMSTIHSSVLSAYKQTIIRKWLETNLYTRMEQEMRTCAILWEREPHHEAVAQFLNKKKSKAK
ncbi:enoyl-CoA hydratase/carnithine racemase [Oikeobacillus pervagus]|uniref:Ethylmalonyl-CoA decarboxylase n=1 Tax=Oikeobacillus pervagus TaxID=1325931 RepID=A0AAJ1T1T3_9BACI|nr:enoyl-CoA hydratase/isomerase family protein [Oikeobacillus pervagus]MDQ0215227.1 enoyl-CoA hydratase/carnithine racemase [Oikeobacillus pervagus]